VSEGRIPERDALLDAVDAIAPTLAAHADASEAARRLAPESVAALRDAGIFSMLAPRELGGVEADPVTQFEVIEKIARIDGATAWCAFIGATGAGLVGGSISDAAAEQIAKTAAPRPWPLFAGAGPPSGVSTRVDGGYRVNGRWGFASGIQHADWLFAGTLVPDPSAPEAPAEMRLVVVPKASVAIEDTWFAAGLKGTGSTHFRMDDVFVPEAFSVGFPTATPRRGGALYRLPLLGFLGPAFAGFPHGVAKRALDEVVELAREKHRLGAIARVADRAAFQRDLALAEGTLRGARLLVVEALHDVWSQLREFGALTEEVGARMLFAFTHGARTASDVATFAFQYAGASSVYSDQPLQRCLRDIQTGAQHILVADHNYEYAGQVRLGIAPPHVMFNRIEGAQAERAGTKRLHGH
jgi:alkylation response protein AidB-like acyl-CoA dehydrogenase